MAGYRSITCTVNNQTNEHLFMTSCNFEHGRWDSGEPIVMESGKTATFKVCSRDSALIGVQGFIKWKGGTDLKEFTVHFDKPYGGGETKFDPSCEDSTHYAFQLEGSKSGHDSTLTLQFYKKA